MGSMDSRDPLTLKSSRRRAARAMIFYAADTPVDNATFITMILSAGGVLGTAITMMWKYIIALHKTQADEAKAMMAKIEEDRSVTQKKLERCETEHEKTRDDMVEYRERFARIEGQLQGMAIPSPAQVAGAALERLDGAPAAQVSIVTPPAQPPPPE